MKEQLISRTVLCYGDSNTYGYNPYTGGRYARNVRWTGRLQDLLGDNYNVVEEGCNGRTTVFDDPVEGWKNGRDYLKPCLNSHKPVDLVVLMLGTNDLKKTFQADLSDIEGGVRMLVHMVQKFTLEKQKSAAKVLLIAPPQIGPDIMEGDFRDSFDESAIERSSHFPEIYQKIAEEMGCEFLNAGACIRPSDADSLHLGPDAHERLAWEVYRKVMHIFGQPVHSQAGYF